MWWVLVVMVGMWGGTAVAGALPGGPLTMAHRSTMVLEDENTLAAMRVAHEHGVDIVEMDPRQTRDGVYVLMHDETVDRTTDGTGLISEMTWEQVQGLRTHRGHRIPSLEEALALASTLNLQVYLDIKTTPDAVAIRELLARTHMMGRAWIGCYTRDELRAFEGADPSLRTIAAWPLAVRTLRGAVREGSDGVATLPFLASRCMIRRAHARELRVVTMPLNREAQLARLHRRGLDLLQSDDLALLQAWRAHNDAADSRP